MGLYTGRCTREAMIAYLLDHFKKIKTWYLSIQFCNPKSDLSIFDWFQEKLLWKLELLEKLWLLKVFFT